VPTRWLTCAFNIHCRSVLCVRCVAVMLTRGVVQHQSLNHVCMYMVCRHAAQESADMEELEPASRHRTARAADPDCGQRLSAPQGMFMRVCVCVCVCMSRMVHTYMRCVAQPGGRMVYSTCSFNPIENEAVVAELLRRFDGLY